MKIKNIVTGELENNTYVVYDETTKEGIIIDPGLRSEIALDYIKENDLKILYIVNTHAHFDHVYGNKFFKEQTGAKLLINNDDLDLLNKARLQSAMFGIMIPESPQPDQFLKDGDIVQCGIINFTVIHTPGHTQGGICLYCANDKILFAGDTLFAGSIGRTDLPGGSYEQLIQSIKNKLLTLPDDTTFYTGHGESSTIGNEKNSNPFLR